MNISLLRHAFVLMSVSLAAALFVPLMTLPRLAVSAHAVGLSLWGLRPGAHEALDRKKTGALIAPAHQALSIDA